MLVWLPKILENPFTSSPLHVLFISPYVPNLDDIRSFSNKYDCLNGANGLLTMTEWREFSFPDLSEIKNRLDTPVIFDGRNLFDTKKVLSEGFNYFAIGKHIPGKEVTRGIYGENRSDSAMFSS